MNFFNIFKIGAGIFLSIGAIGPLAIGSYILISNMLEDQKKNHTDNVNDLDKVSSWLNFLSSNSFKLELTLSTDKYITKYYGTCWSWYYAINQNTNMFEWYLMTNFHVVNSFCYDIWNKDSNQLNKYGYLDNMVFNIDNPKQHFKIFNWLLKTNNYSEIETSNIVDADIIVDNKMDDKNRNPTLFSNYTTIPSKRYALDMSLIRLTFNTDFSNQLHEYNVMNPYELYLTNQIHYNINRFSELESPTYIAGNPHKNNSNVYDNSFVSAEIKYTWLLSYSNLVVQGNDEGIEALRNLRAPYMYTDIFYKNWKLTAGSSGSPVFQKPKDMTVEKFSNLTIDQILSQIIPVGIYWGGQEHRTNNGLIEIKPSIIPFIFDDITNNQYAKYNVFRNFENCYKSNLLWSKN